MDAVEGRTGRMRWTALVAMAGIAGIAVLTVDQMVVTIVAGIIAQHGLSGLLMVTMMAGVILLVARTSRDGKPHAGLTIFEVPADSDGVETRRISTLERRSRFPCWRCGAMRVSPARPQPRSTPGSSGRRMSWDRRSIPDIF